jgi:hypothetical protein
MQNPYLPAQAQALTQQANNNLFNTQLPQINSGAIAAGGFGGSRQGIAQGLAIGQTNQGLASAIGNMSANAWESDQNRGLQRDLGMGQLALGNKQADQGFTLGQGNLALGQTQAANAYNLGLGNLDLGKTQAANNYSLGQGQLALGNKQTDNSFSLGMGGLGLQDKSLDINNYNTNRSLDLSQYGLGASLANQGNLGLSNQGQQLYNNGQQEMQAPAQWLQQYGQMLSPFTGLNQSQSQSTPGGSTLGGAMGGALTAAQIWALLSKGG